MSVSKKMSDKLFYTFILIYIHEALNIFIMVLLLKAKHEYGMEFAYIRIY
jgi:hypothetical protein